MKHVIVTIRDAKAEIFGRPFFAQSVGAAIRAFEDEINRENQENIMYYHPKDFSLYKIGYFEDTDATIEIVEVPQLLVMGDQASTKEKYKISKV